MSSSAQNASNKRDREDDVVDLDSNRPSKRSLSDLPNEIKLLFIRRLLPKRRRPFSFDDWIALCCIFGYNSNPGTEPIRGRGTPRYKTNRWLFEQRVWNVNAQVNYEAQGGDSAACLDSEVDLAKYTQDGAEHTEFLGLLKASKELLELGRGELAADTRLNAAVVFTAASNNYNMATFGAKCDRYRTTIPLAYLFIDVEDIVGMSDDGFDVDAMLQTIGGGVAGFVAGNTQSLQGVVVHLHTGFLADLGPNHDAKNIIDKVIKAIGQLPKNGATLQARLSYLVDQSGNWERKIIDAPCKWVSADGNTPASWTIADEGPLRRKAYDLEAWAERHVTPRDCEHLWSYT